MLVDLHPFALSLIIGLLIGVEREYHERTTKQPLGVRTFTLIALAGTLAAYLGNAIIAAVIAAGTFALIAIGYWQTTKQRGKAADIGLTTEVAAIVTFCTGYIVLSNTRLGVLVGLCTLALLVSRSWMHRFVREKLRKNELTAATVLIVAIFGIAPFLPDHPLDPWGMVNPRNLMILFCVIGLLQFSGYAAIRIFGSRAGLALSGFLGGFVSSTAVFASLKTTLAKNAGFTRAVAAHALLAITATLTELAVVLALALPELLLRLLPSLAAMLISSVGIALLLIRGQQSGKTEHNSRDPLNVASVVKLGLVLFSLIAAVNLAHRAFSDAGLWLIAGISGLFELHGVSLAVALDLKRGAISVDAAMIAVLIAIAASFASKIVLVLTSVRGKLATILTMALLVISAIGFAVAALK